MIKAIIFDMDGTLLDSERLSSASWVQAAQEFGCPIPAEVRRSFIGRTREGVIDILAGLVGDHEAARRFYERHRAIQDEMAKTDLELKPGARDVIAAAHAAGLHVGLATSSRREVAQRNFDQFGMFDQFDAVTCGNEVEHGKPDPEMYLLAAQRSGFAPSCCVAVEDSFNGVKSAVAAGMHVFMIPDLLEPTPEIVELADGVLPSLEDLMDAVRQLDAGGAC